MFLQKMIKHPELCFVLNPLVGFQGLPKPNSGRGEALQLLRGARGASAEAGGAQTWRGQTSHPKFGEKFDGSGCVWVGGVVSFPELGETFVVLFVVGGVIITFVCVASSF